MAERLKDMFLLPEFIRELAHEIKKRLQSFDGETFSHLVLNEQWEQEELKARMRHVTQALHATLPKAFPEALAILKSVAPKFSGFDALIFSDYVGCYGLDNWDLSMDALGIFTLQVSAEFAIRPFLIQDPKRGMAQMSAWAEHEDKQVRRLASEGCRPRLPWAMALPVFKKDPSPILPILDKLKDDSSETVRRSVSNNLNDISKDNPNLALDLAQQWYGKNATLNKIVKHACRGLLKASNKQALLLFGYADPKNIRVTDLALQPKNVYLSKDLTFAFQLHVDTKSACKLRIEYAMSFVKKTGKLSRKVFMIREADFKPGTHRIARKYSFQDLTTRKHYPGEHGLVIIVNGVDMAEANFDVIA